MIPELISPHLPISSEHPCDQMLENVSRYPQGFFGQGLWKDRTLILSGLVLPGRLAVPLCIAVSTTLRRDYLCRKR
jgi:hypothetical protein